jgi:hypothetical protein
MKDTSSVLNRKAGRRAFMKKGMLAAGAATLAGGVLGADLPAFGREDEKSGRLRKGDAAVLRFLAAAEILETDLWRQYAELAGANPTDITFPPGLSFPTGLSPLYIAALSNLDSDMAQYIADNTDDELSHELFINAYLASKGADTVDLSEFANIAPSTVDGVPQVGRLTNLQNLNVDTSWWTRYRSSTRNPDLDPGFVFPQAVKISNRTAIPRSNDDLAGSTLTQPTDHLQAIANTAGFHFAFIEQGGTSLYAAMAQKVTNLTVLRIVLSIGGTEIMHFQTWHDKAGNAVPTKDTDPVTKSFVEFVNLNKTPGGEDFQTNLIMPEPTPFLSSNFPPCSIIRPTGTKGVAMGAVNALTHDGLFIGQQKKEFFELLRDLAEDADEARRECDE